MRRGKRWVTTKRALAVNKLGEHTPAHGRCLRGGSTMKITYPRLVQDE